MTADQNCRTSSAVSFQELPLHAYSDETRRCSETASGETEIKNSFISIAQARREITQGTIFLSVIFTRVSPGPVVFASFVFYREDPSNSASFVSVCVFLLVVHCR